jgi:hypothetical protein
VGFVRRHNGTDVAVGLAKDGSVNFSFSGLNSGTYRDAVSGREVAVSGGTLNFTVEPGSAGIYVLNGPGRIGNPGDGYFQGGSNGGSNPASVEYVPVNPLPGQTLKVIYNGFLASESKVVMHHSWDNWTVGGINDAQMSKVNGKWEATVTVPAAARINFSAAFNNGAGRWDNNNNQDYKTLLGKPAMGVAGAKLPGLQVYPNPSNGQWRIEGIHISADAIAVLDASGRRVPFALEPQGKGWLLRLPGAGAGMYVLRCGGQRAVLMNSAD